MRGTLRNVHGDRDRTEDLLASVTAYGLPTRLRLPDEVLDDGQFDALVAESRSQRVLGMLAAAVAEGAFPVSEEQLERLGAEELSLAKQALVLERLLLRVASVLEHAEVPYRVFKGPALAHRAYPAPRWRMFADLDLLVPSDSFARARDAILGELDGTQPIPELRPGFDEEFGKEALLNVEDREIDLHRTFVTGPVGLTIPLQELFEAPETLRIGGRALPTLGPVAAFLQACINAAVGDFPVRACSLRDVVQLSAVAASDAANVTDTAERWGIGAVLQRAVGLAWPGLGLDGGPLTEWAANYRPPLRERLGLRSYLTTGRSYTRPAASLLVIRGVRPRLRYARSLLFPQRDYLASRGWGLRAHARRALSSVRRSRSRAAG